MRFINSIFAFSIAMIFAAPPAYAAVGRIPNDDVLVGQTTNTTKTLKFNQASKQPGFRYNTSTGSMQFTNDGSTYGDIASTATQAYDSSYLQQNIGIAHSVSSNAMTIALKNKSSTDPSVASPILISFRNATAATGTYTTVTITSALSIVIPSGATLGQVSAVNQYVRVYLLNDAGTVDICVGGVQLFDPANLTASTQISAGATSGTTLYCSLSHTGTKPIALIGRLLVNEATSGTWASDATDALVGEVPKVTRTEITAFPNTTIGTNANCSTNMLCVNTGTTIPAYGSTTFNTAYYYREGAYLYMDWYYAKTSGGTTQSSAIYMLFNVPTASGCTIDTAQTGTSAGTQLTNTPSVGAFDETSTNSGTTYIIKGQLHAWSSTSLTADYVVTESAATANTGFWNAANFMFTSAQNPTSVTLHAKVPCVGWSLYGP